jgi:CheY-like chemotaxis protein
MLVLFLKNITLQLKRVRVLVGNAIKFTDRGEIVIRAETMEESNTHATIHFAVQDTGIGIPPDRQAAVFDRFTQADGSTTRKYGGTGLELTISKQLVEGMDGKIGVESTPGAGSTFWFELRFEKQARKKLTTAPLTIHPGSLAQAHILIVDDNQMNRMVLSKNIEALGSRSEAVPSGAQALDALRHAHRTGDPYHVVLLDMQMPGMDGEQTARAIKSDPAVKEVKIIILTSMGQRGDVSRFEALGCSGYLLKPVKQQMLFDAVTAVLGREEKSGSRFVTRHTLSEQQKPGLRILLAEDNAINQKLAVARLQKAGYSVDAVETGAQALEKIQANPYAAVLMDVQMPEMDGFEAAQRIRELEKHNGQHISIIAMTAHAMQRDRERCLEAGMDDYITKPIQRKVLFSVLDHWTHHAGPSKEEPVPITQDYSAQESSFSLDLDDGLFGKEPSSTADGNRLAALFSQEISTADTVPVDFDSALSRFDGDWDFMWKLFQQYRDQLPDRLTEIHQAVRDGDANRLAHFAHTLKGLSLNFSANTLARYAQALEEIGRHDDLTNAPALVMQLDAEALRVQQYLSTHGL